MQPTVAVGDTDIYSALYIDPDRAARRGLPLDSWRSTLTGVRQLISFQTRAEVLAGARMSSWGQQRIEAATARLDRSPTIPADRDVIGAYAELSAACRRAGHPLHDKIHTGDRWVASSAMAKGLPLFARAGIYEGVPGLTLLT